jgi:hypothetical protein
MVRLFSSGNVVDRRPLGARSDSHYSFVMPGPPAVGHNIGDYMPLRLNIFKKSENNKDLFAFLSILIAALSIVASVVVNLTNNDKELQIKRMELSYEYRKDVYISIYKALRDMKQPITKYRFEELLNIVQEKEIDLEIIYKKDLDFPVDITQIEIIQKKDSYEKLGFSERISIDIWNEINPIVTKMISFIEDNKKEILSL